MKSGFIFPILLIEPCKFRNHAQRHSSIVSIGLLNHLRDRAWQLAARYLRDLSFLLKYGPQLVDSTPRVTRYLDDRRGGVLTRPLHHVLGGLLQLSISVLSLLLLILTSGL